MGRQRIIAKSTSGHFKYSNCDALYHVVKAEAGPETINGEITCCICRGRGPLPAREEKSILKYFLLRAAPEGLIGSDVPTVTAMIASYVGCAAELAHARAQQQAALDAFLIANFDLLALTRAGASTNVTRTGVGTFLATITNNYRSLRAQIAAATTVAAVNASNINSGWPSNP